MLKRIPAAARVYVPPSRAGPSRRMCFGGAIVMLLFGASVQGQEAKAQGALIAAVPARVDSVKAPAASTDSTAKAAAAAKAAEAAKAAAAAEASASVYYENCDAARAAGAAPVRVGDPGYSRKLDRDGDGVGCEN